MVCQRTALPRPATDRWPPQSDLPEMARSRRLRFLLAEPRPGWRGVRFGPRPGIRRDRLFRRWDGGGPPLFPGAFALSPGRRSPDADRALSPYGDGRRRAP